MVIPATRPPLVPGTKDRQHPNTEPGNGGNGDGDGKYNNVSNKFEYLGTESHLEVNEALKQPTWSFVLILLLIIMIIIIYCRLLASLVNVKANLGKQEIKSLADDRVLTKI